MAAVVSAVACYCEELISSTMICFVKHIKSSQIDRWPIAIRCQITTALTERDRLT